MAKRGENIYLRKDGRYEGRYIKGRKEDGQALFGYVYAHKYAEVKQRLMEFKVKIPPPSPACRRSSVKEWLEYWLETLTKPYIRETTHTTYESQIRTHIIPALGDAALGGLTKTMVQEFANGLARKMSAGMTNNIVRLLVSALRAAHGAGMIDNDPCKGVRRMPNKAKTPRVLTITEQKKLERIAMEKERIEYLLCLYTGLRVGELCALRWEDVDVENNMIFVRGALKRVKNGKRTRVIEDMPKTQDSVREIPVPAFVMAYLKRIRRESGRIFAVDVRTMQHRLCRLSKKAGMKGVHMHTLRHTFATRCLEVGVGVETLSGLLGHSSPKVTLTYYAHCTRENMIRSVEKLKQIAC